MARGSTADIYAWGRHGVVKVLRAGIPVAWADREAEVTALVHAAGLPAPATEGVVEVDGRPGILFERVAGVSLWDRMRAEPAALPGTVDRFAGLQSELHRAGPVAGLPSLRARIAEKLGEASPATEADRARALGVLAGLPDGAAPCHGDLHPGNVLADGDRLVVIDWHDGGAGHPAADVARSSILLDPAFREGRPHLEGATEALLAQVHDAYLAAIGTDDGAFGAWRAVQALARLAEPGVAASLLGAWRAWQGPPAG